MNRNLIAILALATASAAMAGDGLDAGSMVRLRALRSGFSATRHDDGSHRMKRKAADSVKTVGGFMELNPTEISSASPVDKGTVIITNRNVFLTACKK